MHNKTQNIPTSSTLIPTDLSQVLSADWGGCSMKCMGWGCTMNVQWVEGLLHVVQSGRELLWCLQKGSEIQRDDWADELFTAAVKDICTVSSTDNFTSIYCKPLHRILHFVSEFFISKRSTVVYNTFFFLGRSCNLKYPYRNITTGDLQNTSEDD